MERPSTQCLLAISLIWTWIMCVCQRGKRQSTRLCVFFKCVFKWRVKLFVFHSVKQHFTQTALLCAQCSASSVFLFFTQLPDHLSFFSTTSVSLLPPLLPIHLPIYLCQSYRKQTWPWQASPSRQRERKLSTSQSRS